MASPAFNTSLPPNNNCSAAQNADTDRSNEELDAELRSVQIKMLMITKTASELNSSNPATFETITRVVKILHERQTCLISLLASRGSL